MLKYITLFGVLLSPMWGALETGETALEEKEWGYYEVNHLDLSHGDPTISHVTLIPRSAAVRTTLEIASVINFSVYRLKDTHLVAQHGSYVNGVLLQLNLFLSLFHPIWTMNTIVIQFQLT